MSKTKQPKKLDVKKQTLRALDGPKLRQAAGGVLEDQPKVNGKYGDTSRGRGTV